MIALVLICLASDDTFARGQELFEQTYFEQAAPILSAFLESPGDAPPAKVTRARTMLAQALFFVGNKAGAARELKVLLKRGGELAGERDFPPDFAEFVAQQRAKTPSAVAAKPAGTPRISKAKVVPAKESEDSAARESTPVAQQSATSPAALKLADEPRLPPWYVRAIPFGVGHLVAQEPIGGAVFMSMTIVAIAANVALAVINGRNRLADGSYPDTNAYPALYALQITSAALFYLTGIASIVDGIAFVPSRVQR